MLRVVVHVRCGATGRASKAWGTDRITAEDTCELFAHSFCGNPLVQSLVTCVMMTSMMLHVCLCACVLHANTPRTVKVVYIVAGTAAVTAAFVHNLCRVCGRRVSRC